MSDNVVGIFSFPGSGADRLSLLLWQWFYQDRSDLLVSEINCGHIADPWSTRAVKEIDSRPTIYMIREIHQVMRSSWQRYRSFDGELQFSDYVKEVIKSTASDPLPAAQMSRVGSWYWSVDAWLRRDGIMVVRYEDVIGDPDLVRLRLSRWLGISSEPLSVDILQESDQYSSYPGIEAPRYCYATKKALRNGVFEARYWAKDNAD